MLQVLAIALALLPQQGILHKTPQQQVNEAQPGDRVVIQSRSFWPELSVSQPMTIVGGWLGTVRCWTGETVAFERTTVTAEPWPSVDVTAIGSFGNLELTGCYVVSNGGTGVGGNRVVVRDSYVAGRRPFTSESFCTYPGPWGAGIYAGRVTVVGSDVRALGGYQTLQWDPSCLFVPSSACELGRSAPAVKASVLLYSPDSTLIGAPAADWLGFGSCPDGGGLPFEAGLALEGWPHVTRF